jgi:hypothetical protein
VKKKASPSDRPPKRPRLPTQERQQVRPIGPPRQSERTGGHNVLLRPNAPAWTLPPPHTPMSCHYTYIPLPPYIPNQMWGAPPYPFGIPQYLAWGAPQSSVFDRLTPPVQDRLKAPQSGSRARAQQDCRTTRTQRPINPVGGHTATSSNRTTKGDFLKIGTTNVIIQEDDKGLMIFDESASTNKKENTTVNKTIKPKYSMPRWCPSGLARSQKRKLQRLRAKEIKEKEAEKIFNDTHPQYPPPQNRWRPKAVEKNQTTTKTENKTTTVQLYAGMVDSPTIKVGSSAQHTDHPTLRPNHPHYTKTPPTTYQQPWRKTTCEEKTWSTTELRQSIQKISKVTNWSGPV